MEKKGTISSGASWRFVKTNPPNRGSIKLSATSRRKTGISSFQADPQVPQELEVGRS